MERSERKWYCIHIENTRKFGFRYSSLVVDVDEAKTEALNGGKSGGDILRERSIETLKNVTAN